MATLNDGRSGVLYDLNNQGLLNDHRSLVSFSEFGRRISENAAAEPITGGVRDARDGGK